MRNALYVFTCTLHEVHVSERQRSLKVVISLVETLAICSYTDLTRKYIVYISYTCILFLITCTVRWPYYFEIF